MSSPLLYPLYLITVPLWVLWQTVRCLVDGLRRAVTRVVPVWFRLTALYLLLWIPLGWVASGAVGYHPAAWRLENWGVHQSGRLVLWLDRHAGTLPGLRGLLRWWLAADVGILERLSWRYWLVVATPPVVALVAALLGSLVLSLAALPRRLAA